MTERPRVAGPHFGRISHSHCPALGIEEYCRTGGSAALKGSKDPFNLFEEEEKQGQGNQCQTPGFKFEELTG